MKEIYKEFKKVAGERLNNIALVDDVKTFVYGDVLNEINKLENLFSFKERNAILIATEKSCYSIILMLLANKNNQVFIPVDSDIKKERFDYILSVCRPKYIIVNAKSDVEENVFIENKNFDCIKKYNNLLLLKSKESNYIKYDKKVSHVFFSSGSTGIPKGIKLNSSSLVRVIKSQSRVMNIKSSIRCAWLLNQGFDASLSDIFVSLFNGGSVNVCSFKQTKVKTLINYFNKNKINYTDISPSVMHLINPESLPTLKTVIFGGEVGNEEIIKSWAENKNLYNSYGPTETTISSSMIKVDNNWTCNNIGVPFKSNVYYIKTRESKELNGFGCCNNTESGELFIGGKNLFEGYFDNFLTNSKLIKINGKMFYKSGDLVKLIDGKYYYSGRSDRQFKLNGVLCTAEEYEYYVKKNGVVLAYLYEKEFVLYYSGRVCEKEVKEMLKRNFHQIPKIIRKDSLNFNSNGKACL